ncbi:unnamed protein product [Closterium sp. NIES-64]|nr:unnamed protein product [Closterium sp. NIES-64]
MGSQHNPDELMGEEELNASFSVDSFAEEAVTPAVSAPPPAKRVCAAGSSSSALVAPPAASVVPPVTPVMAPVAGPSTAAPAPSTLTQEANPVVALAITSRYQRLRRNRENVGVVMLGMSVAPPNDPLFEAIPAVIWVPNVQEHILVNISAHSCGVCSSNHRTRDHSNFAAVQRNRITNLFLITLGQLQNLLPVLSRVL